MHLVTQILISLALASYMVQISQALPTDGMIGKSEGHSLSKRNGLPLVSDLLGGIGNNRSGATPNAVAAENAQLMGHGKISKTGKSTKSKKQKKQKKAKKHLKKNQ